MTSSDSEVELRIDCRNELGETPVWGSDGSTLYWIDVTAPGRVFFWKTRRDQVDFWEFPELVTGIDPMDDAGLMVRATSEIVRFDPATRRTQQLFALPDTSGASRFNDGHCDRAGRLWVGTMVNNFSAAGAGVAASAGQIWCIGHGKTTAIDAQLGCPNAICWSPDYRTFYIADSTNGWLYAHSFDEDTATLGPQRPFFFDGALGIPDGAAVDQEGYLWNARWSAGVLIRVSPRGQLDRTVRLPVSQPTACCFGDADMRTLYITSARYGLSDRQLATEPLAGGVFSLRVDVPGLPLPAYRTSAIPINHSHGAAFI